MSRQEYIEGLHGLCGAGMWLGSQQQFCRGMCCFCADATGSMGLVLNRRGPDLIRHARVDLNLSGETHCR